MGVTTRLAALRSDYRMTQAELADMAGVSRQTINSIETGRFEPSLSLALKLAQLFGKPVEQLFALHETEASEIVALGTPPFPRIVPAR